MKLRDYIEALQETWDLDDELFIQVWGEKEVMSIADEEELPLCEDDAEVILRRLEKRYDDSAWECDTTKQDVINEIKDYLTEKAKEMQYE